MRPFYPFSLTGFLQGAFTYDVHTEEGGEGVVKNGGGCQKFPKFCGFSVHKFWIKGVENAKILRTS